MELALRAQLAGRARCASEAPGVPRATLTAVAGVTFLNDEFNELRAAQCFG